MLSQADGNQSLCNKAAGEESTIQPFLNQKPAQSPLAEIRPLMKAKRKKVTRPPPKAAPCLTLDNFLE